RWLAGLRENLAERRNVIALLPASLEPRAICDALRVELERITGQWPVEVDLRRVADGDDVLATLAAAFGVTARGGLTIEALLNAPELPEVITVRGVDEVATPARACWLDFLTRGAQLSQALAGQRRVPTFLFLTRGESILGDLPATNVRLAVEWW